MKNITVIALLFCFTTFKAQNLEQQLSKADSLWKSNELSQAIDGYRTIIESNALPEMYQSLIYLRLAQAEYHAGRLDDARRTLDKMTALPYIREHHRLKMNELIRVINGSQINYRIPIPSFEKVAATVYVSQEILNEISDGSRTRPYKSIDDGLLALAKQMERKDIPEGVLEIVLIGKKYNIAQPVRMSGELKGTQRNPILIRSFSPEERTEITGGRNLFAWRIEGSQDILARVSPDARFNLIFCSLAENLVTGIDSIVFCGGWGSARIAGAKYVPELFYDGKPQTMARWPNDGDTVISHTLFRGEKARLFSMEKDVWLHGYWNFLWADTYEKLKFSEETDSLVFVPPLNAAGYNNEKWHVINALAAIDTPGEYKITARGLGEYRPDEWNYPPPSSGTVWYYPPKNFNPDLAILSVYGPAFIIENCDYLTIKDTDFRYIRGDALQISNSSVFSLINCIIENVSGNGVIIQGGRQHLFHSSTIQCMGRGGIEIASGDIPTLTSSESVIENCVFRDLGRIDRTYTPAILFQGMGIKIQHCLFENMPSSAVRAEGNDMLLQLCFFRQTNLESDDQGALESFWNPTFRGNIIRWNYFKDIGSDHSKMAASVRLDDAICGYNITENIFMNGSKSVFGGIQIHGGKDNIVEGNIFTDCNAMISQSAWEERRWKYSISNHPVISKSDYWKSDLWLNRYPDLKSLYDNYDKNYSIDNVAVNTKTLYMRASDKMEILNDLRYADDVVDRSLNGIHYQYMQPWHSIPVHEIGPYNSSFEIMTEQREQVEVRTTLDYIPSGNQKIAAALFVSQKARMEQADGSFEHAFTSIEDALASAKIRSSSPGFPCGTIEINILDKVYTMKEPLRITKDFSGTRKNPVIIRSPGKTVISGGVNLFAWKEEFGDVMSMLPLRARRKVIMADLHENGVDATNLVTQSKTRQNPIPEFFYNGVLQPVANLSGGGGIHSSLRDFQHKDLKTWTAEREIWIEGIPGKGKSALYAKVRENESGVLRVEDKYANLDIDQGEWQLINSVTMIDSPGEYKICTRGLFPHKENEWGYREGKGAIWFYPPPHFDPDKAVLSVCENAFILKGVKNVSIENFDYKYFSGEPVLEE